MQNEVIPAGNFYQPCLLDLENLLNIELEMIEKEEMPIYFVNCPVYMKNPESLSGMNSLSVFYLRVLILEVKPLTLGTCG